MEALGLVCMFGLTTIDDIRTKQIKLLQVIVFGIIGIALEIIYKHHSWMSIIGGFCVGAVILAFSIFSKEKIGKGDALIVMVTGLYLGFIDTLSLLWISSIYASVAGLFMIRKYDNFLEHEMPFIPFLLAGYITLMLIHHFGGIIC